MTIRIPPPMPTPGPDDGYEKLTKLANRIEKHVRLYRWLTWVNVVVFGVNAAVLLFLFIANWWVRH